MSSLHQADLFEQNDRDSTNDYYRLPASEKQIRFARALAERSGEILPYEVQNDRQRLSRWIDKVKRKAPVRRDFSNYPSAKQVAFAERIARVKHREIPRECFRDRGLMSRWIDHNKM